jgi:hypothetical protein
MSSPEKEPAKRIQESLTSVKAIQSHWAVRKDKFFDKLIKAKIGIWAECPTAYNVYVKTIYYDRNKKLIGQVYSLVIARRIILKLDEFSIRDIENYKTVSLNSAEDIAEVYSGNVLVNEHDKSLIKIMPITNLSLEEPATISKILKKERRYSTEKIFVFCRRQSGIQDELIEDDFDEAFIDINLESLKILKSDGDKVDVRNDPEYQEFNKIISSSWMSKSLVGMNKFAFKYKLESKSEIESKFDGLSEEDLSDYLSIKNEQKLRDAYKIVTGEWSVFRRGVLGKAQDGRIDVLTAINRLAEINHNAIENGFGREAYVDKRSNKKMDDIFEHRTESNKNFERWIASELPIDKKGYGSAIYKYISEFIRN